MTLCEHCPNEAMAGCDICWSCNERRKEAGAEDPTRYRDVFMRIKVEVCREYGITVKRLMSRDQSGYTVTPRRVIARRFRDEFGMSYPEIGRHLNRDHSTIMSLLRKRCDRIHAARYEDRRTGGAATK